MIMEWTKLLEILAQIIYTELVQMICFLEISRIQTLRLLKARTLKEAMILSKALKEMIWFKVVLEKMWSKAMKELIQYLVDKEMIKS